MSSSLSSGSPVLSDAQHRAQIDRSLCLPLLFFFGSAIFWLVSGVALTVLASWKLSCPTLLDGLPWLTFGRIRPAGTDALIYGWASLAGMGGGLWILARLCAVPLRHTKVLLTAGIFWNLGVLAGVLGIISGGSRSLQYLEFPGYANAILLVAYALIAVWAILLFRERTHTSLYPSQWYFFAAFLWFPWAYATASTLLVWSPVPGPAQSPILAWFGGSLLDLWLTPLALGSIYYIVPKILGRPIFSHALNVLAFWSLALFAAWKGTSQFVGGPVPAWMVSAGVVATFLMVIPVWIIAYNFSRTLIGCTIALNWSPALRFAGTSLVALTVSAVIGALVAMPSANAVFNFTEVLNGQFQLAVLGFVSMALFAVIYFVVPRLTGWEWPSIELIRWHYWLAVVGISLSVLCLILGGMIQGFAMSDAGVTFASGVNLVAPFRFVSAVGEVALLASVVLFAALYTQILLKWGLKKHEPTLFDKPQDLEVTVV